MRKRSMANCMAWGYIWLFVTVLIGATIYYLINGSAEMRGIVIGSLAILLLCASIYKVMWDL